MTTENSAQNVPAFLRQKPNPLAEGHVNNAVAAYCQAKGITSSQISTKRITLSMLLPHLRRQSKKWNDVRLEHLRRSDVEAVKYL